MTLSHEPWLVVLYRSLAVHGSHGREVVDRLVDRPQVPRPRRLPKCADLIRAVGARFGRLLDTTGSVHVVIDHRISHLCSLLRIRLPDFRNDGPQRR
jgi:hypothetical protein